MRERVRVREQEWKKNPTTSHSPFKSILEPKPSEYCDVLRIVVDKSSQIEFLGLADILSEPIWFHCRDTWLSISSSSDTVLQTRENPSSLLLSPGPRESESERGRQRKRNKRGKETQVKVMAGTTASKCEIRSFASVNFLKACHYDLDMRLTLQNQICSDHGNELDPP